MKNTNKKGFTIVELVIVIAVIAILAAVLIPTFVGLVNKANVAADTALIKNLNTALAADTDGCKTMSEALAAAAEYGYDVAKINAKGSDNEILWDSKNNVFCYFDSEKNTVEYIPDSVSGDKATDAELWVISNTVSDTYSTYLFGVENEEVEAIHSLDVGECKGIDVVYNGSSTISIYTNGGDVKINAPQATVHHYGDAGRVHVVSINTASYHVYGNVGNIVVDAGHIVAESGANVNTLVINGSATATAVKDNAVSMVYNNGTGLIEGFAAGSVQESVDYAEDGTFDTNKKALMISTKEALINALNGTTAISAYDRLVLTADLSWDMTETKFETVITAKTTLDLNGHSITVNATQISSGKSYGPFNVQSDEFVIMDSCGNGYIKGKAPEGNTAFDLFLVGGTKSGKLVLNSGSLIMENDDGISYTVDVYTDGKNVACEFVMNGGTVEGLEAVRLWQKNPGAKATVTINSGYLYGDIYFMGDNEEKGEQLTINGGTIVAAKPIRSSYATYKFAKWGEACEVTLNGGTFVNQPNAFTGSSLSYDNIIGTSYDYTATDLTGWTAEKIFNIVDNR